MVNFKYLEIITFGSKEVIARFDLSDKSDSQIDRIERGYNINLNHDKYYTNQSISKIKLEEINP